MTHHPSLSEPFCIHQTPIVPRFFALYRETRFFLYSTFPPLVPSSPSYYDASEFSQPAQIFGCLVICAFGFALSFVPLSFVIRPGPRCSIWLRLAALCFSWFLPRNPSPPLSREC